MGPFRTDPDPAPECGVRLGRLKRLITWLLHTPAGVVTSKLALLLAVHVPLVALSAVYQSISLMIVMAMASGAASAFLVCLSYNKANSAWAPSVAWWLGLVTSLLLWGSLIVTQL